MSNTDNSELITDQYRGYNEIGKEMKHTTLNRSEQWEKVKSIPTPLKAFGPSSNQEDPQFKTGQNTYTIPSDEHPILTELATLCNREYIIGRVSDAPLTTTDTIYLLKLDTIGPAEPGVLMYNT